MSRLDRYVENESTCVSKRRGHPQAVILEAAPHYERRLNIHANL